MPYTEEFVAPPSFILTQEGMTATQQRIFTPYSAAEEVMEDLSGTVVQAGEELLVTDAVNLPGFDYLVLRELRIDPFVPEKIEGLLTGTDGNKSATTEYGITTETYKSLNSDTQSSSSETDDLPDGSIAVPNLEYTIRGRREIITASQWALQWEENDAAGSKQLPDDFRGGFPVSIVDIILKWTDIPSPPWANILSLKGKCNSNEPFFGFTFEEVLFESFDANRRREPQTGARIWDITFNLKARRIALPTGVSDITADITSLRPGWNHRLQPNPANAAKPWVRIQNENGDNIISEGDLSTLLDTPT